MEQNGSHLQVGIVLPGGRAEQQLEQAVLADEAGWDGVFVWEAAYGVDAWTLLGAMAARTRRVKLGTLLTPLPWRRPWKVASQVATLDQLSRGRAILAVGLGAVTDDLPLTGELTDVRQRADLLDEGIDLLHELWDGRRSHHGPAYEFELALDDQMVVARPVQARIPIWAVGAWPRPKSMRRVLRCDGVIPQFTDEESPAQVRAVREWLNAHGASPALDIVMQGQTAADDGTAPAQLAAWADAGCTWWLETLWEMPHHVDERMAQVRRRIVAGPPRPPGASSS